MASKKLYTKAMLRKMLIMRGNRLGKLLELNLPDEIILNEIAMVVTAAELMYGREEVDVCTQLH